MSELPSDFWSGWIAVVTLVSLAGLAWIVFSVYSTEGSSHDDAEEEPVWDGNLREGSNPAPLWWFWMILSTMVFSVIYLMLYPGLGSFQGALKWSQGGRLDESIATYEAEFGGIRSLIAGAQIDTLQADAALMRSAQRIFDRNCAVCHGYEAQGQADLFPDLTDDEWQWGGTIEQIEQSIRGGRLGVMVGWEQVLGGQPGVQNVADYIGVMGTAGADGHAGQAQYNTFCVACHAADGAGNPLLGAPSLVDDVWLYGSDNEALFSSIAIGRAGEMPAFADRLDDTQIRLLIALLTR
jgi:cytochrome c oxidase cbb3-type subunit 3